MRAPVLDRQDHEQGGEHEAQQLDPLADEGGQPGPGQGSGGGARRPGGVADDLHAQQVAPAHAGAVLGGQQRVDLVGDGVDRVQARERAGAYAVEGEAQAVEDVAARDEDGGGGDGGQGLAGPGQRHQQHLHRARVDDQAPHRRPPPGESPGHEQHPRRQPQRHVADDDGRGIAQGVARRRHLGGAGGGRGHGPRLGRHEARPAARSHAETSASGPTADGVTASGGGAGAARDGVGRRPGSEDFRSGARGR